MRIILVDAVNAFVIKWHWIFQEMYDLLEGYSNQKIILTWANEEERERFWLNEMSGFISQNFIFENKRCQSD